MLMKEYKSQLLSFISGVIIGLVPVGVTVWQTNVNLKIQYELFSKSYFNELESLELSFGDNREREDINLRREKLEVLAIIVGDSYAIYRNHLTGNAFIYALKADPAHYNSLKNNVNEIYALKLKAFTMTSLYFPELKESINNYFDKIVNDVEAFIRNEENKEVRLDVFQITGDGARAEHFDGYNELMALIQAEGSKLNQLAMKYTVVN